MLLPVLLPVVLSVVLAACGGSPRPDGLAVPPDAQRATVVRHVDGDTLVLRGRGTGPLPPRPTRVRLLLVDAPEVTGTGECLGRAAADRLAELAPEGGDVRVQADRDPRDRFDRTLLHVWGQDGGSLGRVLLREGLATVLVVQPNVRHLAAYEAAEREAEQAGRGLWSACPPPGG